MLAIPITLLLIFAPPPDSSGDRLSDFSRLSKAIDTQIAIVDQEGIVREGVVTAATADAVTMRFGAGTRSFPRAEVMSAERLRDGRRDGAIKGAIFGVVMALLTAPYDENGQQWSAGLATSVLLYGGIGWALDAAQTHREPILSISGPGPRSEAFASFLGDVEGSAARGCGPGGIHDDVGGQLSDVGAISRASI